MSNTPPVWFLHASRLQRSAQKGPRPHPGQIRRYVLAALTNAQSNDLTRCLLLCRDSVIPDVVSPTNQALGRYGYRMHHVVHSCNAMFSFDEFRPLGIGDRRPLDSKKGKVLSRFGVAYMDIHGPGNVRDLAACSRDCVSISLVVLHNWCGRHLPGLPSLLALFPHTQR